VNNKNSPTNELCFVQSPDRVNLNNKIMYKIEVQSVIKILFPRQYRLGSSGAGVTGLAGKHTGPYG